MSDLKELNETLKKIENKLEDKSPFSIHRLMDFEKMHEDSRKEREEKRNEEILRIQKNQSEMSRIQTESIKKQEGFNKIVAFTGAILALIGVYSFIKDLGLINNTNFWVSYIFLAFVIIGIGFIIKFIWDFYFGDKNGS